MTGPASGRRRCASVRHTAAGPLRPVAGCHGETCGRARGHHVAVTTARHGGMTATGEGSCRRGSHRACRGFCGSPRFGDHGGAIPSTFAGSLDALTGPILAGGIFCAEKSDHRAADGTPCAEKGGGDRSADGREPTAMLAA